MCICTRSRQILDDDSTANTTGNTEGETETVHPNSSTPRFLDCPTALLALNTSEFEIRGNDTIFHDGELVTVLFYDSNGQPLICPDNTSLVLTNRTITVLALLSGIAELTYIGCSLSVLGSGLILLTYGLFSEFRTLPGLLLMNLSLAILITNLLFVIGGPVVQHFPSVNLCTVVAICLHFFNLAQFAWMSLFSIEMAHTFYLAKKLVRNANRNKCRALLLYMLIGWGLPLGICIVTIALNYSGTGLVLYGVTRDGSVGSCWINHFLSFLLSFLLPLVISLLLNLTLFVVVTVFLCQSTRNKSSEPTTTTNHMLLVRVWLAMFTITGVTWVLGFLAIPDPTSLTWYPFVILNSMQGFAIFLAFLCTKKVLMLYIKLLTCKGHPTVASHPKKASTAAKTLANNVRSMELNASIQASSGPPNRGASETILINHGASDAILINQGASDAILVNQGARESLLVNQETSESGETILEAR